MHRARTGQDSNRTVCPKGKLRVGCTYLMPLPLALTTQTANLVLIPGRPVESRTSSPNTFSPPVGPLRRTSPRLQTCARGLSAHTNPSCRPVCQPPSPVRLPTWPQQQLALHTYVGAWLGSIRPAMSSQTLDSCFRLLSFLPSPASRLVTTVVAHGGATAVCSH